MTFNQVFYALTATATWFCMQHVLHDHLRFKKHLTSYQFAVLLLSVFWPLSFTAFLVMMIWEWMSGNREVKL